MKTILIIEDDRDMSDVLSEKLSREGFKVIRAKDGQEGWNLTMSQRPDVIVLDLILPIMNGFDFLEMKRKEGKVSGIPVIILSNLGQQSDVDQCMKLGAKDFVVKAHFTPDDLIARVKNHIG